MNDRVLDQFYEDRDIAYLQTLCDEGEFSGAILGITQQRIAKGFDSLSPKQETLYLVYVQPLLDKAASCMMCERLIRPDDMTICDDCFDNKCSKDD